MDEAAGYHGLVKENETRVEITPRIIAVGAPVCRFEVTDRHHADVPFEVSSIIGFFECFLFSNCLLQLPYTSLVTPFNEVLEYASSSPIGNENYK